MTEPAPAPAPKSEKRRWLRRIAGVTVAHSVVSLLAIFAAFMLGWATFARSLPDPSGWHAEAPADEFAASDADGSYTFDDYLKQEARVFAELDAFIDSDWKSQAGGAFNRFNRASVCFPGSGFDRNWNRTTVLEHPAPRGGALMVHGLSDSPYSLRTAAEKMHEAGWTVVVLRVPGHGTCPGALAETNWRDWASAMRVAVKGVKAKIPADAPIVLFGFSNGGALSINYTLDAIEDPSLPPPDALVLFSPMVGITPFAKITRLYHLIAWIPAFEKVRWSRIEEEVDPYKYSSWPTNASEQAFLLTSRLSTRLRALSDRGDANRLPPMLTFQSAVDATTSVRDLLLRLYDRLPEGPSELVIYDINRLSLLHDLLRDNNEPEIRARIEDPTLKYRITLVTNQSDGSIAVKALSHKGDETTELALDLQWPSEVFSLAHGAVPIPPTDPVYGTREATQPFPAPNLGSLSLRGEHGVLRISEGMMMRLRHNPFYAFSEALTEDWLHEVVTPMVPRR